MRQVLRKESAGNPPRPVRDEGSAAVEFALIVPILLLLISGIIEFSIAFGRQQGLQAAAHQAARAAALPETDTADITAIVTAALDGVPVGSQVNITIDPAMNEPCADAESVEISVTTTSDLRVAFFDVASVTQSGRAEFRCEA